MKVLINVVLLVLISITGFSQETYYTKNGKVSFYSKAPLEDIEAKNRNVVSVFNKSTGQVEISMLMKGFEFEKALMEEHFNENYVESDKFPKAVFKGLINDLSKADLTGNNQFNVTVAGKLTLHGVTNNIEAPATFIINNGAIHGTAEFKLTLEDYKISIPSIVKDKISKEVKIAVEFHYEPLKQ